MQLESKTIFFSLASFLIFIIILSVLGILQPISSNQTEVVIHTNKKNINPPVYYGNPYRKNNIYGPDVYLATTQYGRSNINRYF
jgi:hypothetical protein